MSTRRENYVEDCHLGEVYDLIGKQSQFNKYMFQSFIVFFQMAVFNIITSIYVDKARKLGQPDDEDVIVEKLADEQHEREALMRLFATLDVDRSGQVSFEELKEGLQQPQVAQYFDIHGLKIRNVKLFFDTLSTTTTSSPLPIEAFVD